MKRSSASPPRKSVDKTLTKGLQLVEALSRSDGPRGVSDLAMEMSLTKSNVHRLMQTLVASGYVRKDEDTERYLLTSKLWRLSRLGQPFNDLRHVVRPLLRCTVEKTSDSVLFAAIEGDQLFIVDQVETDNVVRVYFSLGQIFRIDEPIGAGKGLTALQLVALANMPSSYSAARSPNKKSNGDGGISEAGLMQIRKDGFGISHGNWLKDVNAIVVPVFDKAGLLVGVLSCFGPSSRLTEKRFPAIVKLLHDAAYKIRERLS